MSEGLHWLADFLRTMTGIKVHQVLKKLVIKLNILAFKRNRHVNVISKGLVNCLKLKVNPLSMLFMTGKASS